MKNERRTIMQKYYIVKKDGKEYIAETKAGAYEMWDNLGRKDVTIEHRFSAEDASGRIKCYSVIARNIRRCIKNGEIHYYFTWGITKEAE